MTPQSRDQGRNVMAIAAVALGCLGFGVLAMMSMVGSLFLAIGVADIGGGAEAWANAGLALAIPWTVWLACMLGARWVWRRRAGGQMAVALAALPCLLLAGIWLALR